MIALIFLPVFLDSPPADRPALNFTRLLRKYIRLFSESDPLEALLVRIPII